MWSPVLAKPNAVHHPKTGDHKGRPYEGTVLAAGPAFGGKAFCLPYAPIGARHPQRGQACWRALGKAECLPSEERLLSDADDSGAGVAAGQEVDEGVGGFLEAVEFVLQGLELAGFDPLAHLCPGFAIAAGVVED